MAEIRSANKCLILVALVACHAILSAWQIKSVNKKEANSGMEETAKQGTSSINSLQNIEGKKEVFPPPTMSFGDSETSYKDDFRPTSPGISPGVGHSFAQDQQNAESKLVSDNSLKAHDFRSMSPRISPGVGHSFTRRNQRNASKLVSNNSQEAHDFRPTSPGISAGVGHSFAQNQQYAESKFVAHNSQKAGHFMTGVKYDFRPTAPGHSPGVGHAILN